MNRMGPERYASFATVHSLPTGGPCRLWGPGYDLGRYAEQVTRDDAQVARLPLWIQDQSSSPFTLPDTLEDAPLYDGWGRLTGWTQQKNGTQIASYAYSFDQFGNLSTPTGAEVYGASTDRLLQRTDPATGHLWRYFYDRAGNLVSARDSTPGGAALVWTYAYDGLGQLTTVSRSGRGAAGAQLRH